MVNRCADCGNFMEDRELDDIDQARMLLETASDTRRADESLSLSVKALAHIQIWYAQQHREYQQAVAKQRQAQQSMPVPPPAMPYPGAF